MIAIYLAPLYLALVVIILIYKNKSFNNIKYKIFLLSTSSFVLLVFPITVLIGFLLPVSNMKTIVSKIGNFFFGATLFIYFALVVCIVLRVLFKLILRKKYNLNLARILTNIFVVLFTILMCIYGTFNASNIRVSDYVIETNKKLNVNELIIVQISDLHLGYNLSIKEAKSIVNKINDLNPDIVVFTGDLFDNQYNAISNPDEMAKILSSIKSKYGNYAVYGNHDIEEKILCGFTFNVKDKENAQISNEMLDFIEKSGFKFLYDEKVEIKDEFGQSICYLYGRPDYEKPNFGNNTRIEANSITNGLDLDKYIICLDHEPREIEELSNSGVDLDLTGHTHNGQIWPGTITIGLFWDTAYGLKTLNNMNLIVSSGIGNFGPDMRIVANPEIVKITLKQK